MKSARQDQSLTTHTDLHLHRQSWRYLIALLLCLPFYFLVAMLTLQPVQRSLMPMFSGAVQQEVFTALFPIVWRTLIAYAGIVLSIGFILRISFAPLVRHLRQSLGSFPLVFLVFILLLLLWDFLLAAFTDTSLVVNTKAWSDANFSITLAFLLIGLILIPLHALTEEVIYRALPLRGFSLMFRREWLAVALSALLFWLNHGGAHFLYWIPVGVMLGFLALHTRTIAYTWAIHAAFNFYNAEIINTLKGNDYTPALLLRMGKVPTELQLGGSLLGLVIVCILIVKVPFFNRQRSA